MKAKQARLKNEAVLFLTSCFGLVDGAVERSSSEYLKKKSAERERLAEVYSLAALAGSVSVVDPNDAAPASPSTSESGAAAVQEWSKATGQPFLREALRRFVPSKS